MTSRPTLICVVGATAIGKTALAIKLANYYQTEIISADSRQFYKEMKIGTAVPSTTELAAATHHFIQNKSIHDTFTVGDFEREGIELISEILKRKNCAILVGGSGLYVDAITKGLDYFPKTDASFRKDLNVELDKFGLEKLQQELQQVDPQAFETIEISNPRRVIRALEIYRATGKIYSSFLAKKNKNRNFDIIFIGITAERATVYDRINRRVDIMMQEGLLDEATHLLIYKDLNALQTVGYRELFAYLNNECTLEHSVEEIKKNTRRFAKRQGTWFKKNEAIKWFDYETPMDEFTTYINKKSAQ